MVLHNNNNKQKNNNCTGMKGISCDCYKKTRENGRRKNTKKRTETQFLENDKFYLPDTEVHNIVVHSKCNNSG